jgi:RNA polymerase sigma-70 factor, ECF subfamily
MDIQDSYKNYHSIIYCLAKRYAKNNEDAQDLAQDIFIKAHLKGSQFNHNSTYFTWLYRLAINTCIDHVRNLRNKDLDPHKITFLADAESLNHENSVLSKLSLEKLFANFKGQTQEILVLNYLEGLSPVEISQLVGISRQAVEKHLAKFTKIKEGLAAKWFGMVACLICLLV